MKTTEQLLEELAKVGYEWCVFSAQEYGRGFNNWNTEKYLEKYLIKCYKADNSDYMSFIIDELDVKFFEPVEFELSIRHIDKLPDYIKVAKRFLKEEKAKVARLDKTERDQAKQKRIDALKQELEELES